MTNAARRHQAHIKRIHALTPRQERKLVAVARQMRPDEKYRREFARLRRELKLRHEAAVNRKGEISR
jgi:hypothetical protein